MDWVPFVLEDAKSALLQCPQAQDRGMWVAGFYSGATNSILMGGESEAFLLGFSSGSVARENSESKSTHISEVRASAAHARWERERAKKMALNGGRVAIEDANAYANTLAIEDANAMHRTGQDRTGQNRTKQNRTEQDIPPKPPKGRVSFDPNEFDSMIPARIYSEESIEAWHQYAEHRRGKRAKLTELAVNLILKEFATATPKMFAEALRTSVANGWTGVFLGGTRPQAQQITMHPTANRPLRPDEMP